MKIVVLNHADVRVEVLDIPNTMLNENVEQFLSPMLQTCYKQFLYSFYFVKMLSI